MERDNELLEQEWVGISYSRVSSKRQEDGTSLDEQDDGHRNSAAALNIPLVAMFHDVETGRTDDRDDLKAALRMIERGEANVLFIWDHKRLSRKYTDFEKIREKLHDRGARIYFSEERRWAANEGSGRFL